MKFSAPFTNFTEISLVAEFTFTGVWRNTFTRVFAWIHADWPALVRVLIHLVLLAARRDFSEGENECYCDFVSLSALF
jgi:hypothetical protein